ncbi:MAG: hypothetical protein F9K31_01480 [Dokdonella sp.]|nr:MAG: hypothetical protein F9K31_01480 [Dokdonella sp.]
MCARSLDLCCVFTNDSAASQHHDTAQAATRAMRTPRTSLGRWMGALGTGLALPFFSLPLAAVPSQGADALQAAANSSVMARWHEYARSSITPQFSWALQTQPFAAPGVLDSYVEPAQRPSLFEGAGEGASRLSVSIASGLVADTPNVLPAGQTAQFAGLGNAGLQRTVIAPSLMTRWGEHGGVRFTGIFAYQRFANIDLGTLGGSWALLPAQLGTSYGAGARIDFDNQVGERLRWSVGMQSRVGMTPLNSYRGVFSDNGDFDIPASATLSASWLLTPDFSLDAGVQRVQYSQVKPFTSPNLPRRFLALLGDSASPVFAWRDLDIYSVGWTWRDDTLGNLQMRYTTRQQPVPTSRLLADALAPVTAERMLIAGWSRAFGPWHQLSLQASYADSPYYLLMPTYVARANATAGQFEFQALWSARF